VKYAIWDGASVAISV